MEVFVEKASAVTDTLRIQDVLGKRVLAKSGTVLGRVKAVYLNKTKYCIEGVVVRKLFAEDKYICITYIEAISSKAVILSIEPATLYIGTAVVSVDGKKLGTVKAVNRVGVTNTVSSLIVNRGWFRTMEVKRADITQFGTSILLSKTREQVNRDAASN